MARDEQEGAGGVEFVLAQPAARLLSLNERGQQVIARLAAAARDDLAQIVGQGYRRAPGAVIDRRVIGQVQAARQVVGPGVKLVVVPSRNP